MQRIRRLRALGLSLERIKEILGKPDREHEPALRHALQALVEELSAQILELEERRDRLQQLLAQDSVEQAQLPGEPVHPLYLDAVKEHLGAYFSHISEDQWKWSEKIDAFSEHGQLLLRLDEACPVQIGWGKKVFAEKILLNVDQPDELLASLDPTTPSEAQPVACEEDCSDGSNPLFIGGAALLFLLNQNLSCRSLAPMPKKMLDCTWPQLYHGQRAILPV